MHVSRDLDKDGDSPYSYTRLSGPIGLNLNCRMIVLSVATVKQASEGLRDRKNRYNRNILTSLEILFLHGLLPFVRLYLNWINFHEIIDHHVRSYFPECAGVLRLFWRMDSTNWSLFSEFVSVDECDRLFPVNQNNTTLLRPNRMFWTRRVEDDTPFRSIYPMFSTAHYATLDEVIQAYLAEYSSHRLTPAAFAVATPVCWFINVSCLMSKWSHPAFDSKRVVHL